MVSADWQHLRGNGYQICKLQEPLMYTTIHSVTASVVTMIVLLTMYVKRFPF